MVGRPRPRPCQPRQSGLGCPSMANTAFPETPVPQVASIQLIELRIHRDPLTAIREILAFSIHDIVNEARHKRIVFDFFRIASRIERDARRRRRQREMEDEAWVAAHL